MRKDEQRLTVADGRRPTTTRREGTREGGREAGGGTGRVNADSKTAVVRPLPPPPLLYLN